MLHTLPRLSPHPQIQPVEAWRMAPAPQTNAATLRPAPIRTHAMPPQPQRTLSLPPTAHPVSPQLPPSPPSSLPHQCPSRSDQHTRRTCTSARARRALTSANVLAHTFQRRLSPTPPPYRPFDPPFARPRLSAPPSRTSPRREPESHVLAARSSAARQVCTRRSRARRPPPPAAPAPAPAPPELPAAARARARAARARPAHHESVVRRASRAHFFL
jgi:hypothetical protein